MDDITATLRVKSPDLALTETVANVAAATVKPVSGAGTAPNLGAYLFSVRTDDFERFEAALRGDPTIESFSRLVADGPEAVYRFEYDPDATVFSAAIAAVDGISIDWTNDGAAWIVRVWLPDREALASLWEYATDHDVEFSLERVYEHTSFADSRPELTDDQRDGLLLALEMGYFEEPRAATLSDVAEELGVSQPAAGGLLRRGVRRLVESRVAVRSEDATGV
ncbi:helix-turn-helix domain-containing protein [Halobellus ruber]|uniref:Helix-turn-helix domain-containing protein n=1 Tax=Halobellus ruber TaxID=2761102 RepID=A0A7J9SHX9_9EURY|nr:helix-turn-helix domain-containing protein [Halobellus ruber]MBB6646575.1 helix-turn-helix domain-containing protein [Halobellus ruber]